MRTVLVTGANGFVGRYVVEKLLLNDFKVIATGKGGSRVNTIHQNLVYQTLDFTEPLEVARTFHKHKPAIVVHSGAWSKPDDCELDKEEAFTINVTGTIALLKAAEEHKSHFVFLSTDFIFSGQKGFYKEEDEAGPVNYYGETKLLAEQEVKKFPYLYSIVRTVLVYGDPGGGRDNILTMVASKLRKGEQLKIVDDQVRTPTYVEDLAEGIALIIQKAAGGIFHISGEDVLTPYQMACAVAQLLGIDNACIEPVTEKSFAQPARRPLRTGFDISKSKWQLSFKPTPFRDGLKKTIAGLLSHE